MDWVLEKDINMESPEGAECDDSVRRKKYANCRNLYVNENKLKKINTKFSNKWVD